MKNVRINTDQRLNLSLKAGGASIDMTSIDVLSLYMYCNPQKARDGAIKHSVSTSDAKVLEMIWPADVQRYLGSHSVHGTIRYAGAVASFDVPAVNVVSLTSEADISTDTIVLEAPVGTEDLTATISIQGMGPQGPKGEKGDKMTYADLTQEDKEDLYEGGASLIKPLLATKQNSLTDTDDSYGQRVAELEKEGIASQEKLTELESKTKYIESAAITDFADEIILEDNNGDEVGHIGTMTEETFASEQRWESNDGRELYAKIDKNGIDGKVSRIIPEISIPVVVEPSDDLVDEGYSSPIGRNNVKRVDWAAENKYTYYDFLAHYYDGYLGETDRYAVTKRSLGSDASNSGYELFEYDFCPVNYKKVVMISAGMNTCETGALWGLITFIKAMMTSDEEGFKFLRENVRFKILPMICPSSFDKDTLAYPNANGVRINKNFDYCRNWYNISASDKGEYPDSEAESRILKTWLNENAWKSDLYIDCHQDPDKNESQVNDLTIVICSDSATYNKLKECFPSLVQFYRDKGYIPYGVTPNTYSWVESGTNYPKTKYAKEICGIPAIMIEQYCSSTMYGSDGNTINDAAGIKNYATMLRLYTFAILQGEPNVKSCLLSSLIR